jgi:3-dehydroquinate dehydratase
LWTEIRMDYLEGPAPDLQKLFRSLPGPVIATNRLAAEGGRWTGTESGRLALLAAALNLGVTCLDVELAAEKGWVKLQVKLVTYIKSTEEKAQP